MTKSTPKLRDSNKLQAIEPYPVGVIPSDLVVKLCSHIVYLQAVGQKDLSGNDFGDAFARAIGGTHLASPVGVADVVKDKVCWSAKTVKAKHPFDVKAVRLISGRNSPDYSFNIDNVRADVQNTGDAVLQIWNERIKIAYAEYSIVRTIVLVRNDDLSQFVLYEEDTNQVKVSDYQWKVNARGNFIGIDKVSSSTCFTWQPHGAQFTIHSKIPANAIKFDLKHPAQLDEAAFLTTLKYGKEWVHILSN